MIVHQPWCSPSPSLPYTHSGTEKAPCPAGDHDVTEVTGVGRGREVTQVKAERVPATYVQLQRDPEIQVRCLVSSQVSPTLNKVFFTDLFFLKKQPFFV